MKQSFSPAAWWTPPMLAFRATALVCMLAIAGCGTHHKRTKSLESLSEDERAMLQQYENFRASLAQDDFRAVRRAALSLQKVKEPGEAPVPKSLDADLVARMASATGLDQQREVFRGWSRKVITLTEDVQGFYLVHCPLPNCGDWVQKNDKVENPYMGKGMRDCGEIQK